MSPRELWKRAPKDQSGAVLKKFRKAGVEILGERYAPPPKESSPDDTPPHVVLFDDDDSVAEIPVVAAEDTRKSMLETTNSLVAGFLSPRNIAAKLKRQATQLKTERDADRKLTKSLTKSINLSQLGSSEMVSESSSEPSEDLELQTIRAELEAAEANVFRPCFKCGELALKKISERNFS